jgi:hypothetical protein
MGDRDEVEFPLDDEPAVDEEGHLASERHHFVLTGPSMSSKGL